MKQLEKAIPVTVFIHPVMLTTITKSAEMFGLTVEEYLSIDVARRYAKDIYADFLKVEVQNLVMELGRGKNE